MGITYSNLRDGEGRTIGIRCATHAAVKAIGLADDGLQSGARADFVMIVATTPGDALCRRPAGRWVVRRGIVVSG